MLKKILIGLLAFLVLILFIALIGGGSEEEAANEEQQTSQTEQAESKWSDEDTEYQLAVIEKGGFVEYDDGRIDEYARVLDLAEPKCEEDRTKIADMAVGGTQLLEEDGVSATPYEMVQAIIEAVPDELAPMQCSDVLATVMVLMKANQ